MSESVTESERETPVQEAPPVKKSPIPLVDSRPRFGSSPISMVIWASLLAYLASMGLGFWYGSQSSFLAAAISGSVCLVLHRATFSRGPTVTTIRKGLVRLPVLRELEVQRIGAIAGVAATTCSRCAAFDLPLGQHALKQNGDFQMAAAFLRPGQMQKTKGGAWSEDRGFDSRGQPVDEGGADWSQLGGCKKKGILVFAPDSCEDWS